jgi:hypothetical protein
MLEKLARPRALTVLFVGSVLVCSGCGGDPDPASDAAAPATVTVTAPAPVGSALEPATDPTTPELDLQATEPVETPFEEVPEGGSSPEPSSLGTQSSGVPLGLDDVFAATGEWQEDRWDIANRKELMGMGVALRGCGPDSAAELDLRLAHNFSRLDMRVGQANTSTDPDQRLVVEILSGGKQEEIRRVAFDELQPFTLPVESVNALGIRLYLDDEGDSNDCGYDSSVVAVISDLVLT